MNEGRNEVQNDVPADLGARRRGAGVCHTDLLKGRFEWVRLRKFLTEGDARLFQMMRCQKMTDNEVKMLARQYVGSDHFAYIAGRWAKTIR